MVTIDQQAQKDRIKENIRDFHGYFKRNYANYIAERNSVFKSSLTTDDIAFLEATKKPQLEINMSEAYISRMRGEFAKQEPSISVRAADDATHIDPKLIETVEGHIRAIIYDANKDGLEYNCYTECLSGGFSAFKIITEYMHEMSFDQRIKLVSIYDPTLVGFDKLAKESHKGDGMYCFEHFPREKEAFEKEYGKKYTENMKFSRSASDGFNWSYKNGKQEILLLCDYYEKEIKKKKVVRLVTGQTMLSDEYEKFVEDWNKRDDTLILPPAVVGKSKIADFITIARYLVVENDVIDKTPTDYKILPIIFVDGNSAVLRDSPNGYAYQFTRSYLYQTKGMQKMVNFAAINLANEMQNMVQHKWMMPQEGIIAEQKEALIDNQIPAVVIYNQYKDDNPQLPLNPPTAVPRVAAPPELMQIFESGPRVLQAILGSYDAALGINDNQLSGVAMMEGATQSNATAMPYIVNYNKGMNRAAEAILDLLPKYVLEQRSLPVRNLGGKTTYQQVNAPGMPQMDYEPHTLQIKVEAGVNFEIQKKRALDTLIALMKVNPVMAEYMTQESGLEALLDNIDIRGIDAIKQGVGQFIQKKEQEKQMAMQMAQQNNPIAVKKMEIEQKAQKADMEFQTKSAQVAVQKQDSDVELALALNKIQESEDLLLIKGAQIDAQNARTAVESMIKHGDTRHRHAIDIMGMHHKHKTLESKSQKMPKNV